MSFIQASTVQAIAHSVDIPKLSDAATKALAPDVEYRLRELIQDALKFARHSGRQKLTTDDVHSALRLRNVEPMYTFASTTDNARFVRAAGYSDVAFLQDKELSFEQVVDAPLPPPPVDVGVRPHWLFINGVQPSIPENVPIERPPPAKRVKREEHSTLTPVAATPAIKSTVLVSRGLESPAGRTNASAGGSGSAEGSMQVQPPVAMLLTREHQLYFDKVVAVVRGERPAVASIAAAATVAATEQQQQELQNQVIASLAVDPGLHALAPYFMCFLKDQAVAAIRDVEQLHKLLRVARSLLVNPFMHLEPYIHELMPTILTCVVARNIGANPSEDHWSVRDTAAGLLSFVCVRFGDAYYGNHTRVAKTLLKVLQAADKPLESLYGAVVGLACLGTSTVRRCLVPHAQLLVRRLAPLMTDRSARNALRCHEAWRVWGALLGAVGNAMRRAVLLAVAARLPLHFFTRSRTRRRRPDLDLEEEQEEEEQGTLPALAVPPTVPVLPAPSAQSLQPTQHLSTPVQPTQLAQPSQPPGTAAWPAADALLPPGSRVPASDAAIASNGGDHTAAAAAVSACAAPPQQPTPLWGEPPGKAAPDHVATGTSAPAIASGATPAEQSSAPGPSGDSGASDSAGAVEAGAGPAAGGSLLAIAPASTLAPALATGPTANGTSQLTEARPNVVASAVTGAGRPMGWVEAGPSTVVSTSLAAAEPAQPGTTAAAAVVNAVATGSAAKPGGQRAGGSKGGRGGRGKNDLRVRDVLVESWREDADLGQILWALSEVFGEPFVARMPQVELAAAVL